MSGYVDWLWPEIVKYLDDIRAAKDSEAVQRRLLMSRFSMAHKNVEEAMKRYKQTLVVREPVMKTGEG